VGAEIFGRGFIDLWKSRGVSTDLVQVDPEKKTGMYFVSFEGEKHNLTYYRADSAACHIDFDSIDLEMLGRARVLHLSGISQGISEKARETSFRLLKFAKEKGILVSYDVNYRPALWSPDTARAVIGHTIREYADILEITDDEMELLGWGCEPESVPKRLPGPKYHLVKRGPKGAFLSGPDGTAQVGSFKVKVADTVGAGDAFDTGFLLAHLEGMPLAEAGRFAAATAALVCTGTGPLEKQPTRGEVEAFLARA
jgi:2-dehydro-3-deoxygluconokinase